MLTTTSVIPSSMFRMLYSMRLSTNMAPMETTINVSSMGRSLRHTMNLYFCMTIISEVVMARIPDRVVASPCEDMMAGSIVMMKMPNPKPVVRCTKLAPMLSRKISIIMLSISSSV